MLNLKQIFENQFDCYATCEKTQKDGIVIISEEMAMSKEKFIEIVSEIITNISDS